jgi:hypothetical protein
MTSAGDSECPRFDLDLVTLDCPVPWCIRFSGHWGIHLHEGDPEPPKPEAYL